MTQIRKKLTRQEQIQMVIRLSIPAILAEISSVIMQYIDAAMVGSLGANASAAIGLVSSSTWLIGGLCISAATGFSVQTAQLIGAGKKEEARDVLRQAITVSVLISVVLFITGAVLSSSLPVWLGGARDIQSDAAGYFMIYCCALPAVQLRQLSGSMLQCSGDMKTPSILNTCMCGLDIIFNGLLIFPARMVSIGSLSIHIPGADLGVRGAAIGTALAELIIAAVMLWFVCVRSETMHITGKGNWRLQKKCIRSAARIAIPMAFEHSVMCGAQVMSTKIIAPLGTISVAANSLGVTAESLCYMPGYGMGTAATTLVGQSIGAGDKEQARQFARTATLLGAVIMAAMGVLMFFLAPFAFQMLTPDLAVQTLGTKVLRIEMLAEPFYGMSIVAAGALRGAGDTFVPSLMNLFSMWGIRISLAILLAPVLGLTGVWIAMCIELCIRGMLFMIRLLREKWLLNSI